jgi:preprotein translocase subunit YajC
MTLAGWLFLSVSWLVILGLFTFSLIRTLRSKEQNNSRQEEGGTQ